MSYRVKLCQKGSGYRIIFEDRNYQSLLEKIEERIDEFDVKTPHLAIFHYRGKKISISKSSLIIRDCSEEESHEIAEELLDVGN